MLLLSLLALPALAVETVFDANIAASYWPIGLRVAASPGIKIPLWNQEDSVLFGDTSLKATCYCQATPAYARVGGEVTFSPIAVLDLGGRYAYSPYFGTFSSVIGFTGPEEVWTDAVLDAKIDAGERGTGWATTWGAFATLKAMVGPVIIAANGDLTGWDMRPDDSVVVGDYIYEPQLDLLIARQDQVLATTSVLLFDKSDDDDRGMRVGVMDSYSRAFATAATIHRVGPMVTLDTQGGKWSYLLLAQAQLDHRVESMFPPYTAVRVKYTKL